MDRADETYRIGDRIKGFPVVEIHRGGMGVVYVCEAPVEKGPASQGATRRVVFKLIRSARLHSDAARSAFRREALLWTSLPPHPHIVRAFTFEDGHSGLPLIMQEYVDGGSLRNHINTQRLTVCRAVELTLQMCSAMEFVWHASGLVHRDLKPENMLLTREGVLKVGDFGLARPRIEPHGSEPSTPVGPEDLAALSETVAVGAGTLPYMSPEQILGSRELDTRSDIYAVGIVLYELITGHLPFQGPGERDLVTQQLHSEPDYSRIPPEARDGVGAIVANCMRKNPEDRFSAFGEVFDALASQAVAMGLEVAIPSRPSVSELEEQLDATDWANRGYTYGQLGMDDPCLESYKRGLALEPENAALHASKSAVLSRLGDKDEALKAIRHAVMLDPSQPILHFGRARLCLHLELWSEALESLEQHMRLSPDADYGWRELALLHHRLGHESDYRACTTRLLSILNASIAVSPVRVLNEAFQFDRANVDSIARELYGLALTHHPHDARCWYNFGAFLHERAEWQDALSSYSRAVELNPHFIAPRLYRATVLWSAHREADAVEELRLVADSPDPSSFREMAAFLLQHPEAIAHVQSRPKPPRLL